MNHKHNFLFLNTVLLISYLYIVKKSNSVLITSSKREIHLNIHIIQCKSSIKYLGICLDEHLQGEPQIQHVNNNAGIINKLRHC